MRLSLEEIREIKAPIRAFMREHYTDERLAMLLAHARDGKLAYFSCCCFIGVATADHALAGDIGSDYILAAHYKEALGLTGASAADFNYCQLMRIAEGNGNETRRRILIPMIRTEMKRREWARKSAEPAPSEASVEREQEQKVVSA